MNHDDEDEDEDENEDEDEDENDDDDDDDEDEDEDDDDDDDVDDDDDDDDADDDDDDDKDDKEEYNKKLQVKNHNLKQGPRTLHPNVKLSAFPETTYKLHGTLRIQEVSAVSAKDSKTAWRRYSKHVIIYVFKP